MFACIFFEEDLSLSVVSERDKSLEVINTFLPKEPIRMRWGKKVYNGVIVKVSDNEEQLNIFAAKANKQVLEKNKQNDSQDTLLELLVSFEIQKAGVKRQRTQTKKSKESREQEETLSPKKKKVVKEKEEKPSTEESVVVNKSIISSVVEQFGGAKIPADQTNDVVEQVTEVSMPVQKPFLQPALHNKANSMETSHVGTSSGVARPLALSTVTTPMNSNSFQSCTPEPVQTSTTFSESLRVYREAVDTLEGRNQRKDPTQELDVFKAIHILADPKVVAAFETFIKFAGCLAEHMKNATCSHPCLQDVAPQVQADLAQCSFLGDLENSSMSFYQDLTVAEKTSTPFKDRNMPNESLERQETIHQNLGFQTNQMLPRREHDASISNINQPNESLERQETSILQDLGSQTPKQQSQSSSGPDHNASFSGADKVKLLPNCEIYVSRKALKKACITATKKKDNAGFHLMYNLMDQVFTIKEMAESRGTGVGRAHPGEENKPVLDQQKIGVLKQYVNSWCRKNLNGVTFPDKYLNSAVTERNSYARKQLKLQRKKTLNLN